MRRTFDVFVRDLFNEFGYIDARRARFHARRIIAKYTAVGFNQRRSQILERRVYVGKICLVLFCCQPEISYRHEYFSCELRVVSCQFFVIS